MISPDYNIIMVTNQSARTVFETINNVQAWWSEDFNGRSQKTGDSFSVQFGDVHFSKQKLIDITPHHKIVWSVTESCLNFLKKKDEWTGTKIVFEILEQADRTKIVFTHEGLVPEIECFHACRNGWNYYLQNSLLPLLTHGKGQPNKL